MTELKIHVYEGLFRFEWLSPATWPRERRRYWEITVLGRKLRRGIYSYYGITQAVRFEDIELMAREYAALQDDGEIENYKVVETTWD